MPFSFLYPLFWLGLAALAIPLWLHLRRKNEKNSVQFSAVQFLQEQPQAGATPLRLRDVLLFATRALALLLIIAAFAWPYLDIPNATAIEETRVYILDNTLSQQANGNFDRDRKRLVAELDSAGVGVQSGVVELRSEPRVIVPLGESRESARAKLLGLGPSYERGSYAAALRQANSVLDGAPVERRRVIFFGDNQANQWEEQTATPPLLSGIEVTLPETLQPRLPNVAVQEPRVQRIANGSNSVIQLSFCVRHYGEIRSAKVTVHANGRSILEKQLNFENQPETLRFQSRWESDPGNWVHGEVVVEAVPDQLEADDRGFFVVPPQREREIAVLAGSPYLKVGLSPEVMGGAWSPRFLDPDQFTAAAGEKRPAIRAHVLCVESAHLQSPACRRVVETQLDSGRGVVLFVNRLSPTINGYLRELGFEARATVSAKPPYEGFRLVVFNHPVFQPFASPEFGNLMDIKVHGYASLDSKAAHPLLYSQQGQPLLFQSTRFRGQLYVVSFGMDRNNTSWPVHPTFVPFLDLLLQSAAGEQHERTSFAPAEVAQLTFAEAEPGGEVEILEDGKPLSRVRSLEPGGGSWRQDSPRSGARAAIRVPDRPGLYSVKVAGPDSREEWIAVNPPPKESSLIYSDRAPNPADWIVNTTGGPQKGGEPARTGNPAILHQRIWWWMVLGSLAALMLEMTLAGGRKVRT